MKKKIFILVLLVLLAVILCSCSQDINISSDFSSSYETERLEDKFDFIIYGETLPIESKHITSAEELISEEKTDFVPDSVTKLNFGGKEYKVKPTNRKLTQYPLDYFTYEYEYKNGNEEIIFEIDNKSRIHFAILFLNLPDASIDIGAEKRSQIVKEYADKIFDTASYKYEGEQLYDMGSETACYHTFTKYSQGIRTNEYVQIITDISGGIEFYKAGYPDRFDDNSAKAFGDITALQDYAKQMMNDTLRDTQINITEWQEPVISGYKGQTALFLEFAFEDYTDPEYTNHDYGSVIVLPKE